MRILFLSQLLPLPLDAGPKIRAYYVLRHMVEAGHEVTLLCWTRPDDRPGDVQALSRLCRAVVTVPLVRARMKDVRDGLLSAVSGEPFLIRRDRSPAMAAAVARLTGTGAFDAVHADQLWMTSAAEANRSVGFTVLDQHNAVFKVPDRIAEHSRNPLARWLLRAEARKLESFERRTITRFSRVVWVTREDRDALCAAGDGLAGGAGGATGATAPRRHALIPIAVDPAARPVLHRPRPFRVTFLGGLHWPPNAEGLRWFSRAVWPRVRDAVPEAVLTVIGKGRPAWLGALAAGERVDVAGYVADPTPRLEETAAFVVPLRSGAGMRVKILDAWCRGLPVVSTTMGAEGLAVEDGENARLADTPVEFAERLIEVLERRDLAARLAAGGRATVEAHYDWRRTYAAWDEVYR